ncbi:TniB family NTP-binding protein [Laribacter hongkongensis]|uniref:TniB family NTP-binding protein n=1 Tax=Laribacter hongkongensis TaxID=168471 RepID=UPI001EFE0174|nr:TniB family NTP-binding protein [Laribacter hongkongensis]MCG9065634.1 TniB family NTP-binding protein [Laribacter hongkongensis]
MTSSSRKLSARAASLLNAPLEDRIAHINAPLFITYPRAAEILAEMEDLLVHPRTNRMPNLLLVGRSNNGKTEILREFLKRHPADEQLDFDTIYAPVVYIQSPPGPSEHIFLNKMLMMLGITVKSNEAADRKLLQLMEILRQVQTRILLIDELNALLAGSVTKQRFFLNMLKYLGNELQISIVAAGTSDAMQAVRSDAQIESRFPVRTLPRWQEGESFRRLLFSFEYTLPLREPSDIYKGELARKLFGMSEGVIGELAKILRSAAQQAISSGVECITPEVIDACPYVSRRANQGEEFL